MKHIVLGLIVSFFTIGVKAQIPHAYGQMGSQYGGYGMPHGVCPWQTTANRTITNGDITSLRNDKKDAELELAGLKKEKRKYEKAIKKAKGELRGCFNDDGHEAISDYIADDYVGVLVGSTAVSQNGLTTRSIASVSGEIVNTNGTRATTVQQSTRGLCTYSKYVTTQEPLKEVIHKEGSNTYIHVDGKTYRCDSEQINGAKVEVVCTVNGIQKFRKDATGIGVNEETLREECGSLNGQYVVNFVTNNGQPEPRINYMRRLSGSRNCVVDNDKVLDMPKKSVTKLVNYQAECIDKPRDQQTVEDIVPKVQPSDEDKFIADLCSGKDSSLMGRKCKADRSSKRKISATKCESYVRDWMDAGYAVVTDERIETIEEEIAGLEIEIQQEMQDALATGNYITQAGGSASGKRAKSDRTFDSVIGIGVPVLGAAAGYLLGKNQDKRNGINANRMGFPYEGGRLAGQYAVAGGMLGLNVANSALARGSYGCGGRMYGNVGPGGVYGQGYPFITGGMRGPFGYGNIGIGGQVGIPPYGMSPYGMIGMGGNPFGMPGYGAGSPFGIGGTGIGVGINGNAGGPFGPGGFGGPFGGGIYGQGGLGGPGGYGGPFGGGIYGQGGLGGPGGYGGPFGGGIYGQGGLGGPGGYGNPYGGIYGQGGYGGPFGGGIYGQGGLGGPGGFGGPFGGGIYGQGGLGGQGGYGPYGQGGYGQGQYQAMQQYQQQLQAQQQAQIAYQRNQQQRYQAAAQMRQQIQMLNQQMNQILYGGGAGGYAPGGSYGYGGGLNVGFQAGGGIGGGYGPLRPGGPVQNPIGGPIQQPGLPAIQGPAPGQFPTSGPQQQPGQLPGSPNVSFPGR